MKTVREPYRPTAAQQERYRRVVRKRLRPALCTHTMSPAGQMIVTEKVADKPQYMAVIDRQGRLKRGATLQPHADLTDTWACAHYNQGFTNFAGTGDYDTARAWVVDAIRPDDCPPRVGHC